MARIVASDCIICHSWLTRDTSTQTCFDPAGWIVCGLAASCRSVNTFPRHYATCPGCAQVGTPGTNCTPPDTCIFVKRLSAWDALVTDRLNFRAKLYDVSDEIWPSNAPQILTHRCWTLLRAGASASLKHTTANGASCFRKQTQLADSRLQLAFLFEQEDHRPTALLCYP